MERANVSVDALRTTLTYLVPNGTKKGDAVLVPSPPYIDPPREFEGIVVAVDGQDHGTFYSGECRTARPKGERE